MQEKATNPQLLVSTPNNNQSTPIMDKGPSREQVQGLITAQIKETEQVRLVLLHVCG